jgi:hypothetical protein
MLGKNYFDIHGSGLFQKKTKITVSEGDLIVGGKNQETQEKTEDDIFLDTFNAIETPEQKPKKKEENLTLEQKFLKTMEHIDVSDVT